MCAPVNVWCQYTKNGAIPAKFSICITMCALSAHILVMSLSPSEFELNLPEHELVINEDVLVSHGRVLSWAKIATATVEAQASTSLQHTPQRKLMQTLFYLAMMGVSVLVVLEHIGAWWLGVVVTVFLLWAWWAAQRVSVPTVVLHLHDGERLPLLQTSDAALAQSVCSKIALALAYQTPEPAAST